MDERELLSKLGPSRILDSLGFKPDDASTSSLKTLLDASSREYYGVIKAVGRGDPTSVIDNCCNFIFHQSKDSPYMEEIQETSADSLQINLDDPLASELSFVGDDSFYPIGLDKLKFFVKGKEIPRLLIRLLLIVHGFQQEVSAPHLRWLPRL